MAKKQKNLEDYGLHFINRAKKTQTPLIDERVSKDRAYILFGDKNLFPQQLNDLADNSGLHNSILQALEVMVAGKGIMFDGEEAEIAKAEAFYLDALQRSMISDVEFRQRVAHDIAKFNGFYLNVTYLRSGKINFFKHVDYSQMRVSKKLTKDGTPTDYYRSLDWKVGTRLNFTEQTIQFKPEKIPAFDPMKFRDSSKGQVLQIKAYKSGKRFYSEPSYMGVLNFISMSSRIGDFLDNTLKNGMMGNVHIHLFEDLSDPEKRIKIERDINKKFSGDDNAGKIILTYSADEEGKPQIEVIETTDALEVLSNIQDTTGREIAMGHRFPPELVGFDVKLGLSGKDKALNMALNYVQDVVIKPKQQLFESGLDKMLAVEGINATTHVIPLIETENNEEDMEEDFEIEENENLEQDDISIDRE